MTAVKAELVTLEDQDATEVEALRASLADVEHELTVMTTDRDAADADLTAYVKHLNRLDKAVKVLWGAVAAAGASIADDEIVEIIQESLERSRVKAVAEVAAAERAALRAARAA